MNKRLSQSIDKKFFSPSNYQLSRELTSQTFLNNDASPNNHSQPNPQRIPNFLKHTNQLSNSPQSIKHLLLDRFKHRKHVLLQSSSIYIDTGQIRMKHNTKEKNHIISQIKDTSLQKLPYLNKAKLKSNADRLSQTIDAYSSLSKSFSSQLTINESSPTKLTLESSTNLGKAKMHLSNKKSLNQSSQLSNTFAIDQNFHEQHTKPLSPKITNHYFGFNEEVKKKYMKSIVDRYFPNQQSPSTQIQTQINIKKRHKDQQDLNQQKNNKSNSSFSKSDKLPTLKSSKSQPPNPPHRLRSQSTKQHPQSQHLYHQPQQDQTQSLENHNDFIVKSNSSALSLSQSYLLQKIQEDQEDIEGVKGEDFYNSTRLYNSSGSQYFPHLTHQTSEFIMNSSSHDLFDIAKDSHSSLEKQYKPRSQRIKIYENRSFQIFKIKHTSFQNLSQNQNLKTLSVSYEFKKYFLNQPSMELKRRQLRAKSIILTQCGQCFGQMWEQDIFDKSCIKLNITKNSPPCQGKLLPLTLSKMLYKISPQMQSGSSSFLLIKPTITQKPTYVTQHTLLSNSHQGLLSLLLNISLPLSQLSSNLINNKLSLNNLYFRDYNSYSVNQWSYSYFKQQFDIQDKKFQKRLQPILKNQFQEWLVTPQYLAPEILENLCFSKDQVVKYWVKRQGKKMQKSIVKEHDLFQYGNKADVWSMGLMILQIITLIPVWIGEKCIVQNKKNPNIKPRKGFLHSQKRDLLKILTKQSYLKENLNKIIRIQSQPYQIQEWLIKLLHRMLELDAQKRIGFGEIVKVIRTSLKK